MMNAVPSVSSSQNKEFLGALARQEGVSKRTRWRNNNSTQKQKLYCIDLKELSDAPGRIFSDIFRHNCNSGLPPVVAVPVAGWDPEDHSFTNHCFPFFSQRGRRHRLDEEYAQSFSLSDITTAKHAEMALRVSKAAQKMKLFKKGDTHFLRIPAGTRITDIDRYLFKNGFALPPNMPTLHVASFVGAAANGSYGPGFGPMTDNIVEIRGFTPLGKRIVLSAKSNPELFSILRDCHLGTLFVSDVTIANIEPKYLMKRHEFLIDDVPTFAERLEEMPWMLDGNPFIFMYIPTDIRAEGDHFPRIRVTTCERTDEKPSKKPKSTDSKTVSDFLNLMTTEVGEPLIDLIVSSKKLQQFFPFILKSAAVKTYGCDAESTEIDWSAEILHIFRTYTDLPIYDYNWLIQVDSPEEARALLVGLMEMVEIKLKEFAKDDVHPLFNTFARYLKGIHLPEGSGGIAPTATDHEHQSILSFELLTYGDLFKTKEFKKLITLVVDYLEERKLKYNYHPGKHWPGSVRSLTQIFTDTIGAQRLENFQKAVVALHEGEENIPFSPILTDRKKEFIGLKSDFDKNINKETKRSECSKEQEQQALQAIIDLAEEGGDFEVVKLAKELQT